MYLGFKRSMLCLSLVAALSSAATVSSPASAETHERIVGGGSDLPSPPSQSEAPVQLDPLPIDDMMCSEFSDEALESPDSPYCVDSGDPLSAETLANSDAQFISFEDPTTPPRAGVGAVLPNGQFIPGSQNDLSDILNSACRWDYEQPGTIPDRLKGYGHYYNVRRWCCQHSAYLATLAAIKNKIRSEMLRCRWKGGLHLVSGHECTWRNPDGSVFYPPSYNPKSGKPPVVPCVFNYGKVDGYLKACPGQQGIPSNRRDLCVWHTEIVNGKVIEVVNRGYQWCVRRAREGCPKDSIGSLLPTSPGDVGVPPGRIPPGSGPYSCKIVTVTVKGPDGKDRQIQAEQCELKK